MFCQDFRLCYVIFNFIHATINWQIMHTIIMSSRLTTQTTLSRPETEFRSQRIRSGWQIAVHGRPHEEHLYLQSRCHLFSSCQTHVGKLHTVSTCMYTGSQMKNSKWPYPSVMQQYWTRPRPLHRLWPNFQIKVLYLSFPFNKFK